MDATQVKNQLLGHLAIDLFTGDWVQFLFLLEENYGPDKFCLDLFNIFYFVFIYWQFLQQLWCNVVNYLTDSENRSSQEESKKSSNLTQQTDELKCNILVYLLHT